MKPALTKCLIVVPMKDPLASKTRLTDVLRPAQRQSLAKILFKRTLLVLKEVQKNLPDSVVSLAVVTNSPAAAEMAETADVQIIPEGPRHSLSGAADSAAVWAEDHGFDTLCIIPADLAAPDAIDIGQFITLGLKSGRPVVCPSTDQGTNAILVAPPTLIKFSYGKNSSLIHLKSLERAGQTPVVLPMESLRFDIDTSDCLEQAIGQNEDLRLSVGRTG